MTTDRAFEIEFIELLKDLVEATTAMRREVEQIDLLLEEAHQIPMAA